MKRSLLLPALLLGVVALFTSGCVNTVRRPTTSYRGKPRTIALSVTVDGVLQPTPAQFAAIQALAVKQFGALGYVIVTDLSLAEAILRINFTPNPNDPENSGRATALGFRTNPYYASAPSSIARPYPTSFGFAGGYGSNPWGLHSYYGYGFYNYGSSYYDGYSYSSPTLNPVSPPASRPTHPPHRHDPAYCPPDTPRIQPVLGRFQGAYASSNPSNYPPSAREPGRWRGGSDGSGSSSSSSSSWWNTRSSSSSSGGDYSSSSYSRSESSYQRSEPSSSQSAPSYASSYSAPAPSYSSSSDSSSSSSSSSYSGGSSSGSSGTQESTNAHPH